ncbi:MAG: hypothetical protein CM1200mP30_25730 [Pseudomonadota bacterium]|nr:MAG: hypothetical protein CM1200mP30_25730 [Pseudomonadota bacterium]
MNMLNGSFCLKTVLSADGCWGTSWTSGIVLVFWPEITDFERGDENLTPAAIAFWPHFSLHWETLPLHEISTMVSR